MSRLLLCTLFLLFLRASYIEMTWADEADDFIKDCTNATCGGLPIRYPFRLQTSPSYCGAPGLEVSCSGGDAVLALPRIGSCKVIDIEYWSGMVRIKLGESWARCPLRTLNSTNLTTPIYQPLGGYDLLLLSCSKEITRVPEWIAGPISCLGSEGRFGYAAEAYESMDEMPAGCNVDSPVSEISNYENGEDSSFNGAVQYFIRTQEMSLLLTMPEIDTCRACETANKRCGFSRRRNKTYCMSGPHHGPNFKLIVGLSSGGFVVLVLAALLTLLYVIRKSARDQETRVKVEKFLATYNSDAKPTRYSFADVKRMTKRFKDKLGQGGYGSVYKGELPNGIPVAVKMLEKSKGEGEEFINEVATIGRIHHVNIVRLLGFCSEGSTRALVYEFMPNESLEKRIFSRDAKEADKPSLSLEKLLHIATGIARGVEYLHQGCQQRILHFDIKPHNVLLDDELNPKISDFGLAKLCSREQSLVTMTAARGTMGYIAPEMYSRNFGTVSYKSDVYSFGMLVLEMVGGRKNLDPEIGKESEIYFPEWVYDRLVQNQDLGLAMQMEVKEQEEIMKKLVIVALWCIQWSPMDRPSMTRVLQMLTGNLQSLQIPPKPFVSSLDHGN
ncbi:rust resistance kinase Lr10-like [Musa acuminata AAA Group]|uniref:rust resistance kinase Lr10-like n=1 Tax=Musa acuminata AAA Group TaxID=214697 RepID=UPI0031E26982